MAVAAVAAAVHLKVLRVPDIYNNILGLALKLQALVHSCVHPISWVCLWYQKDQTRSRRWKCPAFAVEGLTAVVILVLQVVVLWKNQLAVLRNHLAFVDQ